MAFDFSPYEHMFEQGTDTVWECQYGSLTRDEVDNLVDVRLQSPEIGEHVFYVNELKLAYLGFGKWLVEHGRISEG